MESVEEFARFYEYKEASLTLRKCMDYFRVRIFQYIGLPCWIAGGAVRDYFMHGRVMNDIDIFVANQEIFEEVSKAIADSDTFKADPERFESKNALKFRTKLGKIDLIKLFFPTPHDALKSFDFTVCCAAVQFPLKIIHHENFFIDLASRQLKFSKILYPLSTMRRVNRYLEKGFHIDLDAQFELAQEINSKATIHKTDFYPEVHV